MLSALFETTSKKAFATDPDTLERLTRLQGKCVALDIKKLNLSLYLVIEEDHIAFQSEPEDPEMIDVRLKARPSTLLKIARDGMDDAELEKGELEIEGDAIIGQRFAGMLNALDIDWEELLSEKIGDAPARFIFDIFSKAQQFQSSSKQTIQQNLSEFLVEEARLVSHASQIEHYIQSVDILRNDTARFQARLSELEKKLLS